MRGLVFTPDRNTKRDKRTGKLLSDYTGAFKPQAEAFAEVVSSGIEIFAIDVTRSRKEQREEICNLIRTVGSESILNVVAFFCHGLKDRIQLGFDIETIPELTKAMRGNVYSNVKVPLFCCSTGRDDDTEIADDVDPDNAVGGDGGFADELRDSLCANAYAVDCRVMGHITTGHTTLNPWVRFFDGSGQPYGGTGGFWVIRPKGPLWDNWIRWLRKTSPINPKKLYGNQLTFPLMSLEAIRAGVRHEGCSIQWRP